MDHRSSAVCEECSASTPPSRREESRLPDAERASCPASEPVDDGGSRRMGATEGRNDEVMVGPISERDD